MVITQIKIEYVIFVGKHGSVANLFLLHCNIVHYNLQIMALARHLIYAGILCAAYLMTKIPFF